MKCDNPQVRVSYMKAMKMRWHESFDAKAQQGENEYGG
jgi:hypothetical protein